LTWKITTQKIADKRRFTDAILTDQKNLRFGYRAEQREIEKKKNMSYARVVVVVSSKFGDPDPLLIYSLAGSEYK
jgi:hypothetical protein